MKGSPAREAETSLAKGGNSMAELSSLVTFLITEIRETLHTRIDALNDRINLQCEENNRLKTENEKLKKVITSQEQTITELKQTRENPPSVSVFPNVKPESNLPIQVRPRGIKAHNLIFSCAHVGQRDPKEFIEEILMTKFNRKPAINALRILNTRGPQQLTPEENATGQTESDDDSNNLQPTNKFLVTFNSIWDVKAIYRERIRALKNSQIYISEDLFREESKLYFLSRCLKKRKLIHSTWTEEGTVFIRESQQKLPRILRNDDKILQLETPQEMKTPAKPEKENKVQVSASDSNVNVRDKPNVQLEIKRITRLTKEYPQNNESN